MVKANVDKILDVLRQKKSTSISDLSRILKLKKEDIEKSAEYLEQDGVIKIEHKWPKVFLTLLQETQEPMPLPPTNKPTIQVNMQQQNLQPKKPLPTPPPNIQAKPQNITQQQFNPIKTDSQTQKPLPVSPPNNIQQQNRPQPVVPSLNPQNPVPKIENQQQKPPLKAPQNININNNQIKQTQSQKPPVQMSQEQVTGNTNISNHPNLPPPPVPHNKLTQKKQEINYAEQPMHMILSQQNQTTGPQNIFQRTESQQYNSSNDADPLDPESPNFQMDVPSPGNGNDISLHSEPVFVNSEEYSPRPIDIPQNIKGDMDKIEFLLHKIEYKLNNRNYKKINDYYRKIYSIYMDSEDMSPNERYLISEKINDAFERIKHVYTIEQAI